jgi:MtN3 and saliva related transmembrane protein
MTELIGIIAAILTTSSFLPQAIKTIKKNDTSAISLSMYLMFVIGVAFWLSYGFLLGNLVILISNIITFILAGIILSIKIKNSRHYKK